MCGARVVDDLARPRPLYKLEHQLSVTLSAILLLPLHAMIRSCDTGLAGHEAFPSCHDIFDVACLLSSCHDILARSRRALVWSEGFDL